MNYADCDSRWTGVAPHRRSLGTRTPRIRGVTFILQELRYPGGLIERYCINFAKIVLNKEGPNFRGKGTDGAIALLTNNRTL